ncbi:transposase [Colletotrichum tabaci]|uniref:Transposase n=1 Tax=Colletotrichum tabaci TaxID=1209068 RepID=A0AAV9STC3_9PEZI
MPEVKGIKPANRYNMDETGILEGQGSNGLVLGMAETKSVRKKQPGSRAWVSIVEFQIDQNTKFANIKDIQKAQIEASEKDDITDESSEADLPSESESCIVVASRRSQ